MRAGQAMEEPETPAETAVRRTIGEARTVEEAIRLFSEGTGGCHATYHLAQAACPGYDAPFVRTTYPDAWVARYLLKDYVKIDPVAREGFQRNLPFRWADVEGGSGGRALFTDALRHGIVPDGFSIPIIDRMGRRGLFSVNAHPDRDTWETMIGTRRAEWAEIAHHVHRLALVEVFGRADPALKLAPRELECLRLTAAGKDFKAIAIMLSLSDHTVRSYLKSARYKLGALTLAQAVARAAFLRLI